MADAPVDPVDPVSPRRLRVPRGDGTAFTVTLDTVADPGAPVVLLVPAMGMAAGYYRPFAAGLVAAGLHAAVGEQRGHEEHGHEEREGGVTGPGGPLPPRPGWRVDFGYAEIAADIGLALDALAAVLPDAPVVLLGHSMGGHATVAFVAGHGERVAGLVLLAAGSVWWRLWPVPWWQLVRTQAALLAALVVGHFPGERVGFAGREARGVVRDWARFARRGTLTSGRPPRDHAAALASVRLPVLVVSLAGDVLSPRRACEGLAELLPAADRTQVHLRPGPDDVAVDHFRWARHPALVLGALLPWVGSLPPAQTARG